VTAAGGAGGGQRRLGRGLEALLGPISKEEAQREGLLRDLPLTAVEPNPFQPRQRWDDDALAELAASIEASGLLQPVVVRPHGEGRWQLIAGERRWRAAGKLGWTRIPAVVKEADDRTLLTLALIENLQRDQLTPMDEARGYQRLQEQFGLPQGEVARLVGKSRPLIANTLRLLKLPGKVQGMLEDGTLSAGHGRALLALEDDKALVKMAAAAVEHGWSVRELEDRVARGGKRKGPLPAPRSPLTAQSAEARRIEDVLRKRLATDVRLTARRKGRGTLAISYYSHDDLARLLELILGRPYDG
jgi:ParB family chromosome partitioning protein